MDIATHLRQFEPAIGPEAQSGLLSRREFRYNLFEALQGNGIQDKLKSQLRASIVAELKRKSLFGTSRQTLTGGSLTIRAIDSLIVDYLKRRGSEFTLSVFLPECGLAGAVLDRDDIYRVFNIDNVDARATLVRAFRSEVDKYPDSSAIIIRLLESLFKVLEIPTLEKECQTTMDEIEIVDSELRRLHTHISKTAVSVATADAISARIQSFQADLERKAAADLASALQQYKAVELAAMRAEMQRESAAQMDALAARHDADLARIRADADARVDAARTHGLDDANLRAAADARARADAAAAAHVLAEENSRLKADADALRDRIQVLEDFKREYATKTQEALAEYKIGLNKQHHEMLAAVEVERARIDSEKMVLAERTKIAERMLEEIRQNQSETDSLREQLKSTKLMLANAIKEKDDSLFNIKELKLQLDSQSSNAVLEFEIQSLKTQLLEMATMSETRQAEHQNLIKSLIAPQNDLQKELTKVRKSEARWQRECHELVAKLDFELNQSDELKRKYEDALIKIKELKRDIAELKVTLLRSNVNDSSLRSPFARTLPRNIIPNPLILSPRAESPILARTRQQSTQFQTAPESSRKAPEPSNSCTPIISQELNTFTDLWDRNLREMQAVAYRATQGALGFDDPEVRSSRIADALKVDVDVGASFTDQVLLSLPAVTVTNSVGHADADFHGEEPAEPPLPQPPATPRTPAAGPGPGSAAVATYAATQREASNTSPVKQPREMASDTRQDLQDAIKSILAESPPPSPSPSPSLDRRAGIQLATENTPKTSTTAIQQLLQSEREQERLAQARREETQRQELYERRLADRERRMKELEELEASKETLENHALREAQFEKDMAKLAGLRAREEAVKMNSLEAPALQVSSKNLDDFSSNGEQVQNTKDSDLKILDELEADPVMQKYLALVKEKRERNAADAEQDEKVTKLLSTLENTSLDCSSESAYVRSGDTMDDISCSAPSSVAVDGNGEEKGAKDSSW
ncbi:oxidative DNA demethylase [Entophlyctis luteolus]|nr:oxidative DNA demethylase [Entophlyctis luteolus]